MKKGMKNLCSIILPIIFILVSVSISGAKDTKSKTISKTLKQCPNIELLHKYGPLVIEESTDDDIHIEAIISLDTPSDENAKKIFDQFELDISRNGENVKIKTIFDVKGWFSTSKFVKIHFKDGVKIKGIKNVRIQMVVKLPKLDKLKLSNKYHEIIVNLNLSCDLEVNLYEGEFFCQNVGGDIDLVSKYSKINTGNFINGDFDLYESSVIMGNASDVKCKAKYSDIHLGNLNALELNSHEGSGIVGIVNTDMKIVAKYYDFKVENFSKASIDIYEGSFIAKKGDELKGVAKYAKLYIKECQDFIFQNLYETDIIIMKVNALDIVEAKYCDIEISELTGFVKFNAYEGKLDIIKVTNLTNGIDIESKYTDFRIGLNKNLDYRLMVNLQYTKLNYDESRYVVSKYIEKSQKTNVEAKTKGASNVSPLIKVKAYEGRLSIL